MDPKQSAQLDPKLQEAYNRVMGTVVSPSTPDTTPQPAVATPPATPSTGSGSPTPTLAQATPSQPALPVASLVMPHSTETVRIGGTDPIVQTQPAPSGMVAKPAKKGISPVLLILGGIIFLVAYSIFWVKFLNIPLPYINQ